MNELTVKRFGGVAAAESYKAGLLAIRDFVGAGTDGKDILKLTEDGEWVFGQNNTAIHKKDLLAVNPASFRHGYIAFDDNGIAEDVDGGLAEILRPMGQALPYVEDLPELSEPKSKRAKRKPRWQFQIAIDLVVIEGPNQGAEMVYKPCSNGGLRACRVVGEEIARRIGDTEELVPVVELLSEFYYNKTWGKDVAVPVIEIIEWKDVADGEFASKSGAERPAKEEKTRKGDKVDARKRRVDDDEDEAPRKGAKADRRRDRDEVDSANEDRRGEDDRPRKRTRPAADEVDDTDEDGNERRAKRAAVRDEAPAPRTRSRDADPVDEDDRPRRRVRADDVVDEPKPAERRARRGRDDDSDEAKPAPRERNRRDEDDEDERPRSRRPADDEQEERRPAGPRGRNAAAGRRR